MIDAWYPIDISPKEAELGYELVEIQVGGSFCQNSWYAGWLFVVAKVLGDSDIIVKTTGIFSGVRYVHKRYGKFDWDKFETSKPEWHPLNSPTESDPAQAIMDQTFEADVETPMKIVTSKAEFRRGEKQTH